MTQTEAGQPEYADRCPRLTSQRDHTNFIAPSPALEEARASGCWVPFAMKEPGVHVKQQQVTAITQYSDAREVLSHPNVINGQSSESVEGSRANQPGNLLYKNGDEHRRLRMVLIKHFTVRRVAALRPRVEQIVDQLLDDVESKGSPADLLPIFTQPLPALVFCELMGIPYELHTEVIRLEKILIDLDASMEDNHNATAEMKALVSELVAMKKKSPGSDLTTAIVQSVGDNLSDDEAIGIGSIIITAGMGTTARSTALSILTLMRHPDQLEVVKAKGGLSEADADEMIRYMSPVPAAQLRTASEDIRLGTNHANKNDLLMVSLLSANWDPELTGGKPELDLTRPRAHHVGFGYGEHQCPGQHLAKLEMSVAVSKFFTRFPKARLDCDVHDLRWAEDALIYGIDALPVAW